MVMTFETFIESQFGLCIGLIVMLLGLISFLRAIDKPRAKKTMTSFVIYLSMIILGGYIVAAHMEWI